MNENNEKNIRIVPAEPGDGTLIAYTIMEALGKEICESFTSRGRSLEDVTELFRRCGDSEDSQYSWKNTLKAIDEAGNVCGMVISYDGTRLYELRKRFLDEFERMNGFRIDGNMPDETDAGEWYLDSLAVFPEYRGRGIARRLIEAVRNKAVTSGKPVGLLVDKTNHRAEGLYNRLGFVTVGDRAFAGEIMTHKQIPPLQLSDINHPQPIKQDGSDTLDPLIV